MQKKILTIASAVVLTVAMATTAFAANWVGSVNGSQPSTSTEGVSVGAADAAVVESIEKAENVAAAVGLGSVQDLQAAVNKFNSVVDASTLKVQSVFEVTGKVPADGKVTFQIGSGLIGKVYVIYHQNANGEWEVVGSGTIVDDAGTVVGKFTSFSPVMVMVGDKLPQGNTSSNTNTNTTTSTAVVSSPNTGVNGVEFALVFSIAAAAAVAVFAAKKIKE